MSEWRIRFSCRLEEDMHAGSGTGRLKLIDDCHARDAQGRPVLWYSTLNGLLRNAADELHTLGHPKFEDQGKIVRIFGAEGSNSRSNIVCRSLHFTRPADDSDLNRQTFLSVMSTSREVHSRRPLDQTLRCQEFTAAGLVADGEIRISGTTEDVDLVKRCLSRLSFVGGGKSRGAGKLHISSVRDDDLAKPTEAFGPQSDQHCLRLLLRNLEPICVTATGYPGNILTSESYLPGQTLRGAWLAALTSQNQTNEQFADKLVSQSLADFGNGYVVPNGLAQSENLANLSSIPMPLTAQQKKPTETMVDTNGAPWWVSEPVSDSRDTLWVDTSDDTNDATYKRIKHEDYLITAKENDTDTWRHRSAFSTIMHNRTPVSRLSRKKDSRRIVENGYSEDDLTKASLFSETALSEDQYFVAEIWFNDSQTAQTFADLASAYLSGNVDDRGWLRVGRGGRPVRIEHSEWVKKSGTLAKWNDQLQSAKQPAFSLTLTTDLIARANDLNFITSLNGETLLRLVSPQSKASSIEVHDQASIHESRVVHGFNSAAGTRRSPALAIKRGSSFLVRGGDAKALFDELNMIQQQGGGLGERTDEGFGRFALNHHAHLGGATMALSVGKPDRSSTETENRSQRERVINDVLQTTREIGLQSVCATSKSLPKDFPSRNQWQRLRHLVEVVDQQAKLDDQIDDICRRAETLSGRMWACRLQSGQNVPRLCDELDRARKEVGDLTSQCTFLIYLCRWVVAQLDRLANEKREKGDHS